MRQFILPEDWDGGPLCRVEGSRAHYVSRVLRLSPGDSFPGRDSRGRLWTCRLLESAPGRLSLAVSEPAETLASGGEYGAAFLPRIILVQALPKGAKMDLVIRQAAEAGVTSILPLLSSRAEVRIQEGTGRARMSRWGRIVREARQQSGSGIATEIAQPLNLEELPNARRPRPRSRESEDSLPRVAPCAVLDARVSYRSAGSGRALRRPRGGLLARRGRLPLSEGFKPLRIAGAVLRAETAALYAIAAAQIILSERSSWIPKHL